MFIILYLYSLNTKEGLKQELSAIDPVKIDEEKYDLEIPYITEDHPDHRLKNLKKAQFRYNSSTS